MLKKKAVAVDQREVDYEVPGNLRLYDHIHRSVTPFLTKRLALRSLLENGSRIGQFLRRTKISWPSAPRIAISPFPRLRQVARSLLPDDASYRREKRPVSLASASIDVALDASVTLGLYGHGIRLHWRRRMKRKMFIQAYQVEPEQSKTLPPASRSVEASISSAGFLPMYVSQERIIHILSGSRWFAGRQYYDLLVGLSFQQDGTGERVYGEAPGIRSTVKFRYHLDDANHMRFKFVGIIYGSDIPGVIDKDKAVRTVEFDLQEGPFVINSAYEQYSYRYRLRLSSDPFPDEPGFVDYYGWLLNNN